MNKAFKRVKTNKGAGGIDGMGVEQLLPYLRENGADLIEQIKRGRYKPNPVRRVEIPKEEKGKAKKLGILCSTIGTYDVVYYEYIQLCLFVNIYKLTEMLLQMDIKRVLII